MIIEIKSDIHAYVVYVNGRIRRTGFPTKRAAKAWIKRTIKTCQYCDKEMLDPIWVQHSECMYPMCLECKDRYSDRFSVVIDGAGR